MTGGGKTTLLHSITEQDIHGGAPIIFIDGKEIGSCLKSCCRPWKRQRSRIDQLRVINPMRPDISARYNPFWSDDGNYEDHISFIFESFKMEKDFFEGHQRVYLSLQRASCTTPENASTSTMYWSPPTIRKFSGLRSGSRWIGRVMASISNRQLADVADEVYATAGVIRGPRTRCKDPGTHQ